MIKLNNILTNRVKPKIKEEAQEFMSKITEVMVVSNIWLECQHKVYIYIFFFIWPICNY